MQTLAITGPIYLVIALGFLAVRFGVFSKADMGVLGRFVVKFALPALIFTALSQRPVTEILNPRYMLAYAGGSLAVLLVAFAWGRWQQRKTWSLSALSGMGMSCSNSGFIGFPIAVGVLGASTAAVALAMCMVVENLLMIPLALVLADGDRRDGGRWHEVLGAVFGPLVRNPIFLGLAAGFAVASLGLVLPGPLARTINLLAVSSTAVSLFVIGGALVGLPVKGMRRDMVAVALGKLFLHPAAVGVLVWLWPPADPGLRAAAVLFASVPMLSIFPVLAQKYGAEGFCAAALLFATIVSFGSISLSLWLLGPGLGWLV